MSQKAHPTRSMIRSTQQTTAPICADSVGLVLFIGIHPEKPKRITLQRKASTNNARIARYSALGDSFRSATPARDARIACYPAPGDSLCTRNQLGQKAADPLPTTEKPDSSTTASKTEVQ